MLPFILLFLQIRRTSGLRDVVSVNTKRREVRVRDHRRCDVNNAVVVVVRFSLLGEVTEIVNESVVQLLCLCDDSASRRQFRLRWKL